MLWFREGWKLKDENLDGIWILVAVDPDSYFLFTGISPLVSEVYFRICYILNTFHQVYNGKLNSFSPDLRWQMSSYIFVRWAKFFTSSWYGRIFFHTKDLTKTPPFPREKPSILLSRFAFPIFFCTQVSRTFILCIDLVCLNGIYQFSLSVSSAFFSCLDLHASIAFTSVVIRTVFVN